MRGWDTCVLVSKTLEVFSLIVLSHFFTDIDECLSDPCHSNAVCTNADGSYICECYDGYSGSGHNCTSKCY